MAPSAVSAPATNGLKDGDAADAAKHRVLVVGGAYAGVSAVLGLLNGLDGKPVRPVYGEAESDAPRPRPKKPVEITLVDQRDGFCMYFRPHNSYEAMLNCVCVQSTRLEPRSPT